jgi:hypothetical protein
MEITADLLRVKAQENKKKDNMLKNEFSPRMVLRLIFFVYSYMMTMSSVNVVNCELRTKKECGDQWTQAFTVSSGAATTLWAYITDNPIQSQKRSSSPRRTPISPPAPTSPQPSAGTTRRARRQ